MPNIAAAPPKVKFLFCHTCQEDVEPVVYQRGPHWRADCQKCGKYIQFLKQEAAPKHQKYTNKQGRAFRYRATWRKDKALIS